MISKTGCGMVAAVLVCFMNFAAVNEGLAKDKPGPETIESTVASLVAAHGEEQLRDEFKHHRLGFSDDEIRRWCGDSGLEFDPVIEQLPGSPLTVKFWQARQRGNVHLLSPAQATNGENL